MRKLLIAAAAVSVLAVAPSATAGGWATVGVSPAAPDEAGAVWKMRLNIKQHGRTPLDGVSPSIIVSGPNGETETYAAKPTGEPGIYAAEVAFPDAGTYSYRIDDGFSQVHTFKPIEIVGEGGGSGFPTVPVTVGVALALGLGLALVLVARRRQLGTATAAAGH
jgi:hypothetical protein